MCTTYAVFISSLRMISLDSNEFSLDSMIKGTAQGQKNAADEIVTAGGANDSMISFFVQKFYQNHHFSKNFQFSSTDLIVNF